MRLLFLCWTINAHFYAFLIRLQTQNRQNGELENNTLNRRHLDSPHCPPLGRSDIAGSTQISLLYLQLVTTHVPTPVTSDKDLVVYHCHNNGHQTDRVSQCTAADHDVDPNHIEPLSPCPCCHWHNTAHNTDFESSSSKHKRTSSSSEVVSFQSAST